MSYNFGLDLLPIQQSSDPISEVLGWYDYKFIDNINLFHAVANALRIAAEDPDGELTSKTVIQRFWAKNPTIQLANQPPSKLHDIVRDFRVAKKVLFNWAECMTPSIQLHMCC